MLDKRYLRRFDVLSDFDPVDEVVVHHLELVHVLEQFNRFVVPVETQAAD